MTSTDASGASVVRPTRSRMGTTYPGGCHPRRMSTVLGGVDRVRLLRTFRGPVAKVVPTHGSTILGADDRSGRWRQGPVGHLLVILPVQIARAEDLLDSGPLDQSELATPTARALGS